MSEHPSFHARQIFTAPLFNDLMRAGTRQDNGPGSWVFSLVKMQAERFRNVTLPIYGRACNHTTWRLAKMNLAIRGIDAQIGDGDTFHNGRHPDLKADCVLANPPFNGSVWRGELLKDDRLWVYGVPPAANANLERVRRCGHGTVHNHRASAAHRARALPSMRGHTTIQGESTA